MFFSIQVSQPKFISDKAVERQFLSEEYLENSLEDIFASNSEVAILNWQGIVVPLNYKYDLPTFIGEIIETVLELIEHKSGQKTVFFASSSFMVEWQLTWNDDDLLVKANWMSTSGGIEVLLNKSQTLEIKLLDFLAEWCELLRIVQKYYMGLDIKANSKSIGKIDKILSVVTVRGFHYR